MRNSLLLVKKSLLIISISIGVYSCTYKDIVDIPYPDQNIYMSQSSVATLGPNANGIYTILPGIQGLLYRYAIDAANNKFNVALGVVRSGVKLDGSKPVSITVNTDTISKLITEGKFAAGTQLLPATAYTLPPSVTIEDGNTNASFNLSIDLTFLITNLTRKYAVAVGVVGDGKTADPRLLTTVIFIDPAQVLLPAANFTSYIDNVSKTVNFINASANGRSYLWNFGDGTTPETTISPRHVYAASGTYNVTLTATGVTGTQALKTTNVVIP